MPYYPPRTTSSGGGNVTSRTALGAEPGSSSAGDLDLYSANAMIARYSGSTWNKYGPIWALTEPGTGTWVNQLTSTTDTTSGPGTLLTVPYPGSSPSWSLQVWTAPATPYTVTAAIMPNLYPNGNAQCGLVLRESSTGKFQALSILQGGNMEVQKWTSATAFSALYGGAMVGPRNGTGHIVWFRLTDNGTNIITSISQSGLDWTQVHTISRTDWMAGGPDQYGWGGNPDTGGQTIRPRCIFLTAA